MHNGSFGTLNVPGRGVFGAIVATVAGGWILARAPSIGLEFAVPLAALGFGVAVASAISQHLRRTGLLVVLIASLGVATATHLVLRPSDVEQELYDYSHDLCDDGMWVEGRPTCFEASRNYVIEHFETYDLRRHHGWTEGEQPMSVRFDELGTALRPLIGRPIVSIGEVLVTQEMGGLEQVIQLRGLTPDLAAKVDQSAATLGLAQPAAEASRHPTQTLSLAYCNLPARPFFVPRKGDVLAFKGVIMASGLTRDVGKDRILPLYYVRCSSAERLAQAPQVP